MKPSIIICPNCQNQISIDEALTHQLQEEIEKKLSMQFTSKFEEEKQRWEREEKEKMWKIAQEKAAEKKDQELKLLREENERREKELAKAREQELKLRQERKKLQDEKKAFELEVQRKIDEEREKVRKEAAEIFLKEHQLKDAEKDKQIEDLRKKIEELQLRANLSSQQLQGEILEIEIETLLKNEFPVDEIIPVPKGVNGADVVQKVHDQYGRTCGIIVWESKRTKNWSDEWVKKLKEDMMRVKGDVAVLISIALPEDIKNFGFKDGIYVTGFDTFISLAVILRKALMEQQVIKSSVIGKNEKMEMVYNYVLSNEFRQRVETIAEAFTQMKMDLENEKKVFAKLWAKREKEIERVIHNTVTLHGDLQGLLGSSLPQVRTLEPESLLEDNEEIASQDLLFGEIETRES